MTSTSSRVQSTEGLGVRAALCSLPRFQKRRLDKARQRREEKAAERLEQELLQGSFSGSSCSGVSGWANSGSGCQGCRACVGTRLQLCSSAPADTVKFGEVVLQPPELTAKPRMSVSRDQVSRSSGSCPFCSLMLLGPGHTGEHHVLTD